LFKSVQHGENNLRPLNFQASCSQNENVPKTLFFVSVPAPKSKTNRGDPAGIARKSRTDCDQKVFIKALECHPWKPRRSQAYHSVKEKAKPGALRAPFFFFLRPKAKANCTALFSSSKRKPLRGLCFLSFVIPLGLPGRVGQIAIKKYLLKLSNVILGNRAILRLSLSQRESKARRAARSFLFLSSSEYQSKLHRFVFVLKKKKPRWGLCFLSFVIPLGLPGSSELLAELIKNVLH
jgi:hypothetical protein